ncbi:MAG: YggT family protein [Mariprofundales bacterium]
MFIIGYFLISLAQLLHVVLFFLTIIIFARAVLSWVNPDPYNPIVRFIGQVSEPILTPLQRVVPNMGGVDLSPVIALLALMFIDGFIPSVLQRIGQSMLN